MFVRFLGSWRGLWLLLIPTIFYFAAQNASLNSSKFDTFLLGSITTVVMIVSSCLVLGLLILEDDSIPKSLIAWELVLSFTSALFGGWWFGALNPSISLLEWQSSSAAILPTLTLLRLAFSSNVLYRHFVQEHPRSENVIPIRKVG